VTSADTGKPLRRARITVSSPALSTSSTVSTNTDGRYEVRDLPAGRYTLRVNRSGYLPLAYGQRRPGELGKPLELADKQTAEKVDFVLPRMGVISGRIVDELGEPIPGVLVWAMQVLYYQGARRLVPTSGGNHGTTDDTGEYRLLALSPGDYVVMGHIRETWPLESDPNQIFGYAPSYYPGTATPADAQRVKVAIGQEVGSVDFAMLPGRTVKVSGTVFSAAGLPVVGESVSLAQEVRGPTMQSIFSASSARTAPDGTFSLLNVPAGEYQVSVRVPARNDQPAQELQQTLSVSGVDIEGLVLVAGSGGNVRGRITTDDGSPLPPNVDRLAVRARSLLPGTRPPASATAGKDGAFEMKGLFGPVLLTVAFLSGDWTLKAIEVDGRDIADDPIEVPHGGIISDVRVVLTNRPTIVRGGLTDDKRQPADGTVVIFAEESSRWREDSRTVRSTRPDQNGEFSITGLPAGNYLIAALEYVQEGQWNDPEFLDGLKSRAERMTLAEGERKRVELTLRK
jgi:hypothetical protein